MHYPYHLVFIIAPILMSILIVPFTANTNLEIYRISASLPFVRKKPECLLKIYVNLGAGL